MIVALHRVWNWRIASFAAMRNLVANRGIADRSSRMNSIYNWG